MYTIENKQAAIKQIQRFLGINETGNYDENIRKSVAEHQESKGLFSTGIVDYETFNSLLFNYKNRKAESSDNITSLFSPKFPYKTGDFDYNVGIINSMLRNIFETYNLESKLPRGDYYGSDTAMAVCEMRRIFLMPEGDEVDVLLFRRMVLERDMIEMKNKFNEIL